MFNKILAKTLKLIGYVLETIEEALEFAEKVNKSKAGIIFNCIGEHTKNPKQIYQSFSHYCKLLQCDKDISIKLSQFEMQQKSAFSKHSYLIHALAKETALKKRMLWIDAEEYNKSSEQLMVAIQLAEKFGKDSFCPIGLTIQLRADNCISDAVECFKRGIKVRLCEGAYPKKQSDPTSSLYAVRTIAMQSKSKGLLEVATMRNIKLVMLAIEYKLPLQILYGWHKRFLDYPYKLTIYVPFGTHWWPYIKRRIREKISKGG